MDLLLIRCADLEAAAPVRAAGAAPARPLPDALGSVLSERGEKHSRRLAAWLRSHAPRQLQIFSSPARGARQMAAVFGEALPANPPPVVSRLLAPDGNAAGILGAVGWPHDHAAALVVAHQPALGALASLLLTGQEAALPFRRGAVWWFSNRHRDGGLQTVLRCVVPPDLLRSGAAGKSPAPDGPAAFGGEFPDVVELRRRRLAGAAG